MGMRNFANARGHNTNARASSIAAIILGATVVGTSLFSSQPPAEAAANGCTVTVDNPHYSNNTGGVIAKARVTCMSKSTVEFSGSLGSGPAVGPHATVAQNIREIRVVDPATREYETFYIPRTDSSKVQCVGDTFYSGFGSITVSGATDQASSTRVTVAC